jgi:hypothetical protein
MAKYKPKTSSKRNTPWTDEDRRHLRTLYEQGVSAWNMAQLLDRSTGAIYQQIYIMRKQDATEGYVHITDHGMVNLSLVSDEEQAKKLSEFRLYEGVYPEPKDAPQPSLWQRIRNFFRK